MAKSAAKRARASLRRIPPTSGRRSCRACARVRSASSGPVHGRRVPRRRVRRAASPNPSRALPRKAPPGCGSARAGADRSRAAGVRARGRRGRGRRRRRAAAPWRRWTDRSRCGVRGWRALLPARVRSRCRGSPRAGGRPAPPHGAG